MPNITSLRQIRDLSDQLVVGTFDPRKVLNKPVPENTDINKSNLTRLD